MVTHPFDVLSRLTSEQNFDLLVTFLAPVFFLPVLAPRYLLPVAAAPGRSTWSPTCRGEAVFGQQTVAITAFVFIATAFALSRIGRHGCRAGHVDRRVLGALLLVGIGVLRA